MSLSHKDARDLYEYFTYAGQAERSIQGPILDKMWLMSLKHRKAREPITARPTAESRDVARVEPNLEKLEVFGRVSRKMRRLSAANRAILEAFHGDEGSCAAERSKKYGRISCLFRFTEAGKALIRAQRAESKLRLTPAQLMQNAVSKQEIEADKGVSSVSLSQAQLQAIELKEKAEDAYSALTAADKAEEERKKRDGEVKRPRKLRIVPFSAKEK